MDELMLEDRLRRALRDGETRLAPAPDLAESTRALGRGVVRRRRRTAVAAAAAVVCLVAGLTVALSAHHEPRSEPPANPDHHEDETSAPLLSGAWAMSLPTGAPPTVPFVAETDVHLIDRTVRLDEYDDLAMVGQTVAGTVVLAEKDLPDFSSEFVLVRPDGTTQVIADGLTRGVQEEAVSPDGRYFTAGGIVLDMSDLSQVAELPQDAQIVAGWVPAGLLYADARNRLFLWNPGAEPSPIDHWLWFPGPFDVGITTESGCPQVVEILSTGDRTEHPARCVARHALSVSPGAEWLVTRDLRLVDEATGEARWLAGAPVSSGRIDAPAVWEDDDHVLVSLQQDGYAAGGEHVVFVVRCEATTGDCERAGPPVQIGEREYVDPAWPIRSGRG